MIKEITSLLHEVFKSTESNISRMVNKAEQTAWKKLYSLKIFVTRTALEISLLLFGIGFFLIGLVLLLGNIIRIDILLLLLGLILINIVLIFGRFK